MSSTRIVEALLEKWHTATLTDYAHVVLGVIIVGWFIARRDK